MNAVCIFALFFTLFCVLQDISHARIENSAILTGMIFGLLIQLQRNGAAGVRLFLSGALTPAAVLFILFYFRAMGAGDIKLLCVLGGLMGPEAVLYCIGWSFAFGAVLSVPLMILSGNFRSRLRYFAGYTGEYLSTGIKRPYRTGTSGPEMLHFTVPVFMAVLFWTGGVYS